jgi:hypothetical protein
MKLLSFALACATVFVSSPVWAQAAKTVQLSKVIVDTTSGEVKGKMKGGTLCVFPSKWDFTKEKKTDDYERYDQLFSAKMKSMGYAVVTTSGDLFAGQDGKNSADFLVGATVRPDTLNVCSSVSGFKGAMTLIVEWQIYDRAAQKVVATISTSGDGSLAKFSQNGWAEMWNQAFVANLTKLLDQGAVQKFTGAPAALPAAAAAPSAASAPAAP